MPSRLFKLVAYKLITLKGILEYESCLIVRVQLFSVIEQQIDSEVEK